MSDEKKPTPPSSGNGGSPAGGAVAPCTDTIVKINAKVPGTKGVRDPSKKRPDNTLRGSSSSDESLGGNAPVILVRGCLDVELSVETNPPGKPVKWKVKPNENSESAPTITPAEGQKAKLKTDKTGSFSVIATLGSSKVVWNVVFVWVKVDVASTTVTTRDNKYAPSGTGGVKSGGFSAGNYAWESKVDVKLKGGGTDGSIGIDKIEVHVLQNGVTDTLTGHYDGGGTASETVTGGLPVVDSTANSSDSPYSPFITNPVAGKITPNQTDKDRRVWTGDSPAGGFPVTHSGKKLKSISGVNGFRTAVAATSTEAPTEIVVHADIKWTADYSGDINAAGVYSPNGAKTTSDAKYALISEATGGQDAFDAGMETFPPIFRDVGTSFSF